MKNLNLFVIGGIVSAYYGRVELMLFFLVLYLVSQVDAIKFKA
jgi:hypothetical protein